MENIRKKIQDFDVKEQSPEVRFILINLLVHYERKGNTPYFIDFDEAFALQPVFRAGILSEMEPTRIGWNTVRFSGSMRETDLTDLKSKLINLYSHG